MLLSTRRANSSPVGTCGQAHRARPSRADPRRRPATGARYGAGDVMVLVRSRNALFEAVIRALKREKACPSPAPTAWC